MKILVDIGIGLLLYVLETALQIPIASIFRGPFITAPGLGERIPTLTGEYLVGAVIFFLLSYMAAWVFRTRDAAQAWRRAVIWTVITVALNLGLEVINAADVGELGWSKVGRMVVNTLGTPAYYVALLGLFLGPLVYCLMRARKQQPDAG